MEKYVSAEVEVIAFEAEDVITESTTICSSDGCQEVSHAAGS